MALSFAVAAVNFGVPPASKSSSVTLCLGWALGCQRVFLNVPVPVQLSASLVPYNKESFSSLHSGAFPLVDCCCFLLSACWSHGEGWKRSSCLLSWSSLSPRQILYAWVLWWGFHRDPVSPPCGSQTLPCPFSKFYLSEFPDLSQQ